MALWKIKRQTVNVGTELPGQVAITCLMEDTETGEQAVEVVNMNTGTFTDTPAALLAALVTAGYTPNDWGGV